MQGAARAIGWEFWRRHRWGWMALAGYLGAFSLAQLFLTGAGPRIRLDPPNGLAGFVIAPVSMTFFFLVGVFSYGLSGDLSARHSIYPTRMLTLPVTTKALAGWPMLFGTVTAAGLWLATVIFLRLAGTDVEVPLLWPALFTASYLAWTQAFMWMPYGLPGLRVAVAVLWLAAVDAVVLVALHYHAAEWRMLVMLAPQIPLAYLVAGAAVARARAGDVPDWRPVFVTRRRVDPARDRFRSAARAQAWVEWRRYGRSLPAMIAIVVPVELLLLFVPGNQTVPVVVVTLLVVLITPPFMAIFAGAAAGRPSSFMMTRPLSAGALAAAEFKASLRSTLSAWLLVLTLFPVAVWLSGTEPIVIERIRAAHDTFGAGRTTALALLVLAVLIGSTWKHMVLTVCIGLTGRDWFVRATLLIALGLFAAAGPLAEWVIDDKHVRVAIWASLPSVLAILATVKMTAAVWAVSRVHRDRLLTDGMLILTAAGWAGAVFALYGVLVWFVDTPFVPHHVLMLTAILVVPLTRITAAPLALAWSRHR